MAVHDSPRDLGYARARHAARHWVDSYRPHGKLYPAICRCCGATEWHGRWRWDGDIPDLPPVVCPACERIRDGVAAHTLELTGALPRWWNEVKAMIAHVERAEVHDHPLERVMRIDIRDDRVVVPTTGVHIARRIVASLVRRWRHALRLRFGETSTQIEWLEPGHA